MKAKILGNCNEEAVDRARNLGLPEPEPEVTDFIFRESEVSAANLDKGGIFIYLKSGLCFQLVYDPNLWIRLEKICLEAE